MRDLRGLLLAILSLFTCGVLTAQQYQVINVSNGGKISGTVKWAGSTPHVPSVAINKDPQICDPEAHKTRDLERLVIGPQGGVANTVVFLQDITSGKPMELPAQRRFLDQKGCRYEPHILLVPAGEELHMKSSDATLHTIHMEGAATYNLPFPFPNQVVSREMHTPGLVSLKCNGGHTWMNAEMLIVSHPYYAVTDESGRFELSNVPPGQYTLVAWHEGWTVAREEGAFDVLTERRVQRPIFTLPRTWQKTLRVSPNSETVANFTLSDK